MPYDWLSSAFGGGPTGVFVVLLAVITTTFYLNLLAQIAERRAENASLRATLERLTDVIESWMPEQQRRKVPRR